MQSIKVEPSKPSKTPSKRYVHFDGSLLSETDEVLAGKVKVPNIFQVAIKMITGGWLSLGGVDANPRLSRRDNFIAEQNNIALVSALILTIQAAVLYAAHEFPFQNMGKTLAGAVGNSGLTSRWMNDVNYTLIIISSGSNLAALILSVCYLLIVGQLSSEQEFEQFFRVMKGKIHMSFFLTLMGSTFLFLHAVMHLLSSIQDEAYRFGNLGFIVFTSFCSIFIFAPPLKGLYKTKLTRAYHKEVLGPIVHSRAKLDQSLKTFAELVGPELVSPTNFEQYLREEHEKSKGPCADLAHITRLRLEKVVEDFCNDILDKDSSEEPGPPRGRKSGKA